MEFKDRLIKAMEEKGMTQSRLSQLTGIGKSSISQYVSGKNIPTAARRRKLEKAMGLEEGALEEKDAGRIERMTVRECAQVMGLSRDKLVSGLEAGIFAPWGICIPPEKEGERPVYWINKKLFYQINMPWAKGE